MLSSESMLQHNLYIKKNINPTCLVLEIRESHEMTFALFSVSFIIIALRIINSEFLLGKFFAKKRSPKQHAQGNSLENFRKITKFWERKL